MHKKAKAIIGIAVIAVCTAGGAGMIWENQKNNSDTRSDYKKAQTMTVMNQEKEHIGAAAVQWNTIGSAGMMGIATEVAAITENGLAVEETEPAKSEGTKTLTPQETEPAGIDEQEIVMAEPVSYFFPTAITEDIFARISGLSYKKNCTVPREELRYIKVLHYDFNGEIQEGELIVNAGIADDAANVFRELYESCYPIEKIRLVDEYGADDNRSMADNNTSAFNFRTIDGSRKLSNHAQGFAIDINPLYNPYVRTKNGAVQVLPENAAGYADRTAGHPYFIRQGDACYQIFAKYGFSWGGEWEHSKDYQHFEKTAE